MPSFSSFSSSPSFSLVAAKLAETNGIGSKGTLPWRIPSDLKLFHDLTTSEKVIDKEGLRNTRLGNVVIMGRKTWDSLPMKAKPLPGRINVIISQTLKVSQQDTECFQVYPTLTSALNAFLRYQVFIIGGARLYEEAIQHPCCGEIYLTNIRCPKPPVCDTFFPEISHDKFRLKKLTKEWSDGEYQLQLQIWERIRDSQC